jgi:hypothetical protein
MTSKMLSGGRVGVGRRDEGAEGWRDGKMGGRRDGGTEGQRELIEGRTYLQKAFPKTAAGTKNLNIPISKFWI